MGWLDSLHTGDNYSVIPGRKERSKSVIVNGYSFNVYKKKGDIRDATFYIRCKHASSGCKARGFIKDGFARMADPDRVKHTCQAEGSRTDAQYQQAITELKNRSADTSSNLDVSNFVL